MQSLTFNVAQLLKQAVGATRTYELVEDLAGLTDEVRFTAPLRGEVKFTRTIDGVLVTGNLTTETKLVCRRFAIEFSQPIKLALEEEFRSAYDVNTGLKLPPREDDEEATMISEQHMLDLSEVLRQDLILAVPPFPVCREDCKGLCPHCGKDLNEGTCDCSEEESDPRWAALQELLNKDSVA
jgi:uncharacterized protein